MITKLSQIPGVKSVKGMKELFEHISNELTKFHQKSHAEFSQKLYRGNSGKVGKNVNNRR